MLAQSAGAYYLLVLRAKVLAYRKSEDRSGRCTTAAPVFSLGADVLLGLIINLVLCSSYIGLCIVCLVSPHCTEKWSSKLPPSQQRVKGHFPVASGLKAISKSVFLSVTVPSKGCVDMWPLYVMRLVVHLFKVLILFLEQHSWNTYTLWLFNLNWDLHKMTPQTVNYWGRCPTDT